MFLLLHLCFWLEGAKILSLVTFSVLKLFAFILTVKKKEHVLKTLVLIGPGNFYKKNSVSPKVLMPFNYSIFVIRGPRNVRCAGRQFVAISGSISVCGRAASVSRGRLLYHPIFCLHRGMHITRAVLSAAREPCSVTS